ncbi:MAG: hypothetical protein EA353_04000 [Puniceicoccaceae bacterium]|nr:MAG: hypothetical protein EA353_04000 [Puniceicoccaceae bacterium]
MNYLTKLSNIGALGMLGVSMLSATIAEPIEFKLTTSVSNRYVSEGIDNDPESSAFSFVEVTAESHGFLFGAWYAQSLRGSATNEANLFGEYGFDVGPIELFAGVNYLTFPALEDNDTWELYLGFEYAVLEKLIAYGLTYYDIDEVKGGFLELGLLVPLAPGGFDGRLEFAPYAQVGADYGYVSGPRRLRANNFQVGIGASYGVNESVEIFGSANHSFRLKNLRNEGEGDVSWVEAGVAVRF